MKIQLALVLSVFGVTTGFADVGDSVTSFTTLSGRTYRGVTIAQVQPDGVTFRHASGAGKVLFADLPHAMRQTLGYDATKAEAYEKELAAKREREQLARVERDKEIAKAQASAFAAAAAKANLLHAQYSVAAAQASYAYGYGFNYPLALDWIGPGFGGQWGRNHDGRGFDGGRSSGFQRINHGRIGAQPFTAGQITSGPPYSGVTGNAPFTNGVPALGSSFVAQPVRTPPVISTGIRPVSPGR